MRHKGSVSQVNIERDRLVPALFRKAKGLVQWPTRMMAICEYVALMPAPEFFISSDTAVVYIRRRYCQNIQKPFQSRYKQMLYDALYERFVELMETPGMKLSIPAAVLRALESPAPCCGLSPWQIYSIMLRHNKQSGKSGRRT